MELLHREEGLVVGDNEPYSITDASDYTIPWTSSCWCAAFSLVYGSWFDAVLPSPSLGQRPYNVGTPLSAATVSVASR